MLMRKKLKNAWIAKVALNLMLKEAESRTPYETGGVLIGYTNQLQIVITNIIGPGPCAKHETTSFVPDDVYQKKQIEFYYRKSQRLHGYLGDWHSHPCEAPELSHRDMETLNHISEYKPA